MNQSAAASERPKSLVRRLHRILRIGLLREAMPELDIRGVVLLNQLPSAIAAAIVLVLYAAADWRAATDNVWLWLGMAAIVVATGAAALLPWKRWPGRVSLWVPVLDMAAFFAMSVTGFRTLTGVSILMALPLFRLAWTRSKPGLVLSASFIAPLAVVWSQAAQSAAGLTAQTLLKPLLVPVVVFAFTATVSVMSSVVDATQERMRSALAKAEEQALLLNAVLDTANVGVVVVDEDGHDLMMNRNQLAIHEALVPDGVDDPDEADLLVFGADRKALLLPDERPVRRAVLGEEFSGQLIWGGRDGELRAFSTSASRMRDVNGQEHGAVIAFHDITNLMDALAAKDDFLATVNHELRTPLTSIVGYLEMASEVADLDPAVKVYLNVAERNAERLLALVGDLLDAAAGKVDITMDPLDLAGVLQTVLPAHVARAERQGLTVTTRIAHRLDMAGDERRVGQIVDNLLSNALKYTPDGGSITVSAYAAPDGRPMLEVADTGSGMTMQEQGNLFTRFYRTAGVRRTAIPGAGLGLAITKELVEAHGGSISVRSEPGIGSIFAVEFPAPEGYGAEGPSRRS